MDSTVHETGQFNEDLFESAEQIASKLNSDSATSPMDAPKTVDNKKARKSFATLTKEDI